MNSLRIKKTSLIDRTADTIEETIRLGTWKMWLPTELQLCDQLGISRGTLRAALQKLKDQGILEAVRSKGTRIKKTPPLKGIKSSGKTVCVLLQETLGEIGLRTTLLIEEFRSQLFNLNLDVRIIGGRKYFSRNPNKSLTKLVDREQISCWVLAHSNPVVQRWFNKRNLPCIVLGASPPEIDLPRCHVDVFASSRHAAQTLVRNGHRNITLLNHKDSLRSQESKQGFLEGTESFSYPNILASVVEHDHSPEDIKKKIQSILRKKNRPTAIIVAHPYFYISAFSTACEMNISVPNELSIISLSLDPYLSFMNPRPSCYDWNTRTTTKALVTLVAKIVNRETLTQKEINVVPEFVPGNSIGKGPHIKN